MLHLHKVLILVLVLSPLSIATFNENGRTKMEAVLDAMWLSKPAQWVSNSWEKEFRAIHKAGEESYPDASEEDKEFIKKIAAELNIDISDVAIKYFPEEALEKVPSGIAAAGPGSLVINKEQFHHPRLSEGIRAFIIRHELMHLKHNDAATSRALANVAATSGTLVSVIPTYSLINTLMKYDLLTGRSKKVGIGSKIGLVTAALFGAWYAFYKLRYVLLPQKLSRFVEKRADTLAAHQAKSALEALRNRQMGSCYEGPLNNAGYLSGKDFYDVADEFMVQGRYGDMTEEQKAIFNTYLDVVNPIKNDQTLTQEERFEKVREAREKYLEQLI